MNYKDSLDVIKFNIARIHDTVKNIVLLKKKLQNNSLEAKGDIHSNISRQLEALRSREVWLLDQVDTIQHVKQSILDDQLNHMQHELGAAKAILDNATSAPENMEVDQQLQAAITSLEQLKFEFEDGEIQFTCDNKHLRDSIYRFGHIQANKRSIIDNETANKKPCLSDVRQVNHGELYRSLTELKENKDKFLDGVPTLAVENNEWLIKTPTNTPTEPCSDLLFPPFRRNECLSDWLQTVQEVAEINSLQNDEEAHHDDDVAESDVVSFEMITDSHQETESPVVIRAYFDQIRTSPDDEWLQSSAEKIRMEYEMGSSYPYAVMKYFRDISKDTRVWLADYEQRKKIEDYEDESKEALMSCTGQCACTAVSPIVQNIEIENLDDLICVREPASKSTKHHVGEMENEMTSADIGKVCRANETCTSFSECVCDRKCCEGFLQSESVHSSEYSIPEVTNQWLSPVPNKNTSVPSTFPYFQRVRSESNSDWLVTRHESEVHSSPVNPMKVYLATRSDKHCDWLSPKEQESEEWEVVGDNIWLAKKEKLFEELPPESDISKTIKNHHSNYSKSDWLDTSSQRQTSSEKNLLPFDAWKTVTTHHSKFTEVDWRLKTTDNKDKTNEEIKSQDVDSNRWLMSCTKEGKGDCTWLRTHTKVSDWLLDSVSDDIRGIVCKMDDVHLTSQSSKWLLCDQPNDMDQTLAKSENDTLTSFPCLSDKSPRKTWLKE